MKVYFFGVWGQIGHYMYDPSGATVSHEEKNESIPRALHSPDGVYAGDPKKVARWYDSAAGKRTIPSWNSEDQVQGKARLLLVEGWTILAFWDCSGDPRGGSNSNFLAEGTYSFEEMKLLAEKHFPSVWGRIMKTFEVTLNGGEAPKGRKENV